MIEIELQTAHPTMLPWQKAALGIGGIIIVGGIAWWAGREAGWW